MPDLEKVINGLECCMSEKTCHSPCPYNGECEERGYYYSKAIEDALALLKAQEPITGETSDGYHTFNELYHHRAVLFSVIVANYPDRAWKSKKHHDGTMYDGMFIVGVETQSGQATYHYDINPYWDMFKCQELEYAPEWDGHTPAQAIERIGELAGLKAQEPRVMTLGEALAADYVYLEIKLHASLPCDCCILAIDPDGGILPLKKGFAGYLDGEEYGETWRCWTQRPSEEQRRDTPWTT